MSIPSKTEARARARSVLADIDRKQAQAWSSLICHTILDELDLRPDATVMAYLGEGTELNIDPMIEACLAAGVRVAVPDVGQDGYEMIPVALNSLKPGELTVDRFGIRVPRDRHLIDPEDLNVVVVPALAFDPLCNRLGRGAGFYDRFLKSLADHIIRAGVCFSPQVLEPLPIDPHDAPMDLVITQDRVYRAAGD